MTSLEPNSDPEPDNEIQGLLARERNRQRLMLLFMALVLALEPVAQLGGRAMSGMGIGGFAERFALFLFEYAVWIFCNALMAAIVSWRAASIINGWSFIACLVVLSWITFFSGGTLQVLWLIRDQGLLGLTYIASFVAMFAVALTIAASAVCLAALATRRAWTRVMTFVRD